MGLVVVDYVSRTGEVTGSSGPMSEAAAKQRMNMLVTDETRGDGMRIRPPTADELAGLDIPIPPA